MRKDFSEYNSKKITNSFIKEFGAVIGFIRFVWRRQNMRFKSKQDFSSHGSGTALSRRHILTCSHCVYSEIYGKNCDEVIFYPNVEDGQLKQLIGYKATQKLFFKSSIVTKSDKPKKQQLCLIFLDRDMPYASNQQFPKIGNILQKQKITLHISGYITELLDKTYDPEYSKVKRTDWIGQHFSIKDDIIEHNLPTQKGVSGAAIFAGNSKGSYTICGIHTHKTPDISHRMGLYFTEEIINQLKRYQKQLSEIARDQENRIQYTQDYSQKYVSVQYLLKQFNERCNFGDSSSEYSESCSEMSLFEDIFFQSIKDKEQNWEQKGSSTKQIQLESLSEFD